MLNLSDDRIVYMNRSCAHLLGIVLRNCSVKQCLHKGQILRKESQLLLEIDNIGVHIVAFSKFVVPEAVGRFCWQCRCLHELAVPSEV